MHQQHRNLAPVPRVLRLLLVVEQAGVRNLLLDARNVRPERVDDKERLAVQFFGANVKYGENNPSYFILKEQAEGDIIDELNYNEKLKFSKDTKELSPAQLATLIEHIKQRAPKAFVEQDQENYQIIVDYINRPAYDFLSEFA